MKETVELIIAQIKMLERTYDFAVGETTDDGLAQGDTQVGGDV